MSQRIQTPTLLQTEPVESGAAALGIVLRYYGSSVSLEELRYVCGVAGHEGSRARNLVKAARYYGLDAEGLRRSDLDDLRKLPLPQILLWNNSQFVVLEGVGGRSVAINDPATGRRTVSRKEFEAAYSGLTLVLQPGESFQRVGTPFEAGHALREPLHGLRRAILFLLLVSLLLVIPGIVFPALLRVFVDDILTDGQKWLSPLLVGMGIAALLSAVLAWLQRTALLRMEIVVTARASAHLMGHILRLPIAFFEQRSGGDIAARMELNGRIARLLSGELALAVVGVLMLPFYALVMLQYSVILTVISLLFVLFNLFVLYYVSRRRRDTARLALYARRSLIAALMNGLRAVETYKALGAESRLLTRWTSLQARLSAFEQQISYSTYLLSAISVFLFAMNAAIVLIAGGGLVLQGTLTVGMLAAFQSLLFGFSLPVSQLISLASRWHEAESALEMSQDVLANPTERLTSENAPDDTDTAGALTGRLEVRSLSFGYQPLQSPFIQDFSLAIQPGGRVALVGASASGKTTVARVLAGVYTPWVGEILLDGQERRAIPRAVLNHSVALIDQEAAFFSGTVQENLTLWDEYAPLTDLWRAAKDADIHEIILNRPGGYDYMVGERGRNFSAGERQRLSIARALLHNPALLILDEATQALDPASEAHLLENLGWRGCSCLIITQRLSTIRDCDEIIVMDAGKIVERGTHDELLARGGRYANMLDAEARAGEAVDAPHSGLIPAWLQNYEVTPIAVETAVGAAATSDDTPRAIRPLPGTPLSAFGLLRFGLRSARASLLVLIITGLIGGLLGLALPLLTTTVIDNALPRADRELLQVVGLTLALAALGMALFQWIRGAAAVRIQAHLETQLQPALWDHLLGLRASFFRSFTTGDLAERALGLSQIKLALADAVALSPFAALFSLTSLVLLFYFDAPLALIAVVLLVGSLALTYGLGGFGRSLAHIHAELHGETSGLVFQLVHAISKLRAAGAELRAFGVWVRLMQWQQRQKFKAERAQSLAHVFITVYPLLASIAVFALVYARRTLTVGEFVGFNLAFSQLNIAAVQFGKALIALRHAAPYYARVQPLLLAAPEADSTRQAPRELSGAITVRNLSFRYAEDHALALSDVSFRIEPGEFVAVVGASGSGKSTLLRLLIGFEQPGEGEIAFDGQALSRLDAQTLRRQLGVVLDDTQPLAGSILSNIAAGRDLTTDAIWRAARLAGMDADIGRMPQGLYTYVGEEGIPLSSGLRQRLLIARALAANPRIILLDNTSGALSDEAQAQLMRNLTRVDATRIVITNRLHVAAAANRILVLHEGRLVESGTYASLSRSGRFLALAQAQSR